MKSDRVRTTIILEQKLYVQLRVRAAVEITTSSEIIRRALEAYLRK